MKIFAIVGKPNVGKSTLFNRLAKKRLAIVNEQPGVTRDRNIAAVDYKSYHFFLIDTGGFEPESKEVIPQKMKEQSQLAVEEADGIIFLLDKSSGWTSQDQEIYNYLRRSQKPIYFTVNKIDHTKHEPELAEFYESGSNQIFPISAEHGKGVLSLLATMGEDFPDILGQEKSKAENDKLLSIAIVGRPNSGKSSLLNQIIGKTKQIVHDEPGTTRDPVDNYIKYHGQTCRLIDTAGIRRKSRVSFIVDKYSMIAAIKSIERADVVLLVVDAVEGVVEQDARIAGYIVERGKALIIVVNKWDLVHKDNKTLDRMKEEIRTKLRFLDFAPIVFVSAKTKQRISSIMEKVTQIYQEYSKRIQTADLNRIVQSISTRHTPPATRHKRTKLFYATQVASQPPSFVITSNFPKSINLSYHRYIVSQFRYFFGFEGTPIRIFWRDKSQKNRKKNTRNEKA